MHNRTAGWLKFTTYIVLRGGDVLQGLVFPGHPPPVNVLLPDRHQAGGVTRVEAHVTHQGGVQLRRIMTRKII